MNWSCTWAQPEPDLPDGSLGQFPRIAQLDERFGVGRRSAGHRPAPFELGIELGAEQDGNVGDPQPHEEDDDRGEAAVDLAVVSEVRDIEGEETRGDKPADDRYEAAGTDPAETLLRVRTGPVEQGEHQADQDEQDGPF